jgi:hypothetical protein
MFMLLFAHRSSSMPACLPAYLPTCMHACMHECMNASRTIRESRMVMYGSRVPCVSCSGGASWNGMSGHGSILHANLTMHRSSHISCTRRPGPFGSHGRPSIRSRSGIKSVWGDWGNDAGQCPLMMQWWSANEAQEVLYFIVVILYKKRGFMRRKWAIGPSQLSGLKHLAFPRALNQHAFSS